MNSSPATAPDPISVRIPEAVRLTGISRSVLYELIRTGELQSAKLGRTTLVPVVSLRALVEKNTRKAA